MKTRVDTNPRGSGAGAVELLDMDALADFIGKSPTWHVLVLQYGATHAVLRLALHQGDYPRHAELICGGTEYFRGATTGGPYVLTVAPAPDGSGQFVLADTGGAFEVRCSDFAFGPGRPRPAESGS